MDTKIYTRTNKIRKILLEKESLDLQSKKTNPSKINSRTISDVLKQCENITVYYENDEYTIDKRNKINKSNTSLTKISTDTRLKEDTILSTEHSVSSDRDLKESPMKDKLDIVYDSWVYLKKIASSISPNNHNYSTDLNTLKFNKINISTTQNNYVAHKLIEKKTYKKSVTIGSYMNLNKNKLDELTAIIKESINKKQSMLQGTNIYII